MFKLNSKGASTEPCGSPLFRVLCLLLLLPMITVRNLLLSILFMIPLIVLHGITRRSLVISPSRHTVSYAAVRSMKIAADFNPFSKPSSIFAVSDRTWSQQFLFGLNPACFIGIVLFTVSTIRLYISLSKIL